MKRGREHLLPQEFLLGMLTRTITRAQFASPSSHGAGSGLRSVRLKQFVSMRKRLRELRNVTDMIKKLYNASNLLSSYIW